MPAVAELSLLRETSDTAYVNFLRGFATGVYLNQRDTVLIERTSMVRVLADSMKGHPDPSDFIEEVLSRIPSTFGKLVSLADADDDKTGAASLAHGRPHIEAALRRKHREMFLAWLGLALPAQTQAVAEYFTALAGGQSPIIVQLFERWLHERLYEGLVPAGTSDQERKLFATDMKAILQLLQIRLGFAREKPQG